VGEAEKAQTHLHDLVQQDSHNPRLRLACEHAQAVWAAAEGQTVTAISHLETAVNLADEMGLPGEQWQILAKLSELYSDKVKQQAAKNQAAEIVNRLAEQMGDEKLREGFTTAVTAHIL